MTWLEHDRAGMQTLVEMLPRHNTDHGQLSRHATVYSVELDAEHDGASAVTSFACYRTMLDGINSHLDAGETRLFLIGKYHDRFRLEAGRPLFVERTVRLVRLVREAVGVGADLLVGTHGQFTTSGAIRLAKHLEPFDPLWFEEPVPPEMPEQMAIVARGTSIPIATGERFAPKTVRREGLSRSRSFTQISSSEPLPAENASRLPSGENRGVW